MPFKFPVSFENVFPGGKDGRSVKLSTHFHLVPRIMCSLVHYVIDSNVSGHSYIEQVVIATELWFCIQKELCSNLGRVIGCTEFLCDFQCSTSKEATTAY